MKLKIEYLAPYLPYGLNCYNEMHNRKEILNIVIKDGIKECTVSHLFDYDFYKIKPILRPLSDLTKLGSNERWWRDKIALGITKLDYESIQELLKEHFDLFGLIPKGLAIDMNTL